MNVTINRSVEPDQAVTLVNETFNLCDLIAEHPSQGKPIDSSNIKYTYCTSVSAYAYLHQWLLLGFYLLNSITYNHTSQGLYQVQMAGNTQTTKSIFCVYNMCDLSLE